MRLVRLHLLAFGPFTDRVLDLGDGDRRLVVLHGPNEAGKSCALRAISDLRFGIPMQSKDNFLHKHPDMRIGGEFVDRHGNAHALLRRKGRGATLLQARFDAEEVQVGEAAAPDVEALLTGGLAKEAYDAMFGLDHRRLREGGQALLKGEGDVGAALFEASAGVRSIPRMLAALDASARECFMPGARGKNARINEALKAYEDNHAELRRVQVRPPRWAELLRRHELAETALKELERRRNELHAQLLLVKELRAVAPLLRGLDQQVASLQALQGTPALSPTAAGDRAAAEAGLRDAVVNADAARDEVVRQQAIIDASTPDSAILQVADAVRRLAAGTEEMHRHRLDMAQAEVDVRETGEQVATLAARIHPTLTPEAVLAMAPSKADKARIRQQLQDLENAARDLDEHLEAGRRSAAGDTADEIALPPAEARTALRAAQAEVQRASGELERLAALPADIKAAQRRVSSSLAALGLADEAALRGLRPLVDAQIDAAIQEEGRQETRRDGISTRIRDISDALSKATEALAQSLDAGVVATRSDVDAARTHRERGWRLLRARYVDGGDAGQDADIEGYGDGLPLDRAYEAAVSNADRLADAYASDTERAAQVQGLTREIDAMEADRLKLEQELSQARNEEQARQEAWRATLQQAGLPTLTPRALRDWQAKLPGAQQACETLQTRLDEAQRLADIEKALSAELHAAIVATGLATPAAFTTLRTLTAMAAEVAEIIRQREETRQQATGRAAEQARQRLQRAAREAELRAALESARQGPRAHCERLALPPDANVDIVRARLAELDDLVDAGARLAAARAMRDRAAQALGVIEASVLAVQRALGDTGTPDLRLYIDHAVARLDAADAVRQARRLAEQARDQALADQKRHEQTAARHRAVLDDLCRVAGVEAAHLLPAVEERAREQREAREACARMQQQLAQASSRGIDELRVLLAGQDTERMDADEATWTAEQAALDADLPKARQDEEAARRELEAIDAADTAAAAREAMERAAAAVRTHMPIWVRTKLAHALLAQALKGFRERAQGPMLRSASAYFARMTRGGFQRLLQDEDGDEPVLIAQRSQGAHLRVEEMSEGTRDQLYLSLRLAALDIRREAGVDLPVVLDDILMTSDDERSGAMLEALADFARHTQVLVFTHHRHVMDLAARHVPAGLLAQVSL